jgi:hypothetical protein
MEIMHKEGAVKENKSLESALVAYLEMMDRETYFGAHEVLENVWYPMRKSRDDLANLLKGLINAAVAFEHLKRKKPGAKERARKVMRSYDRHTPLCSRVVSNSELFGAACKKVQLLKEKHPEVFDVLVS